MSRLGLGTRIAVLPDVVRNQIAAGEVIERPASLVKELCENSLDAGARSIVVDLEEGGARLVRVTDDGCGMPPEDLALAFEPHATSKLRDSADLQHIASLGFRGEALASMGSVARCRIFSRAAGAELGASVENEGGRISKVREAGGAAGSIVEVRDLFYNTPARRRFLKRTSTELGHCLDVVQRMALAHTDVGFAVTHDGKRAFDVERDMDLLARIRRTFGAELAESLVEVSAASGGARLYGYVAPPRFARRDAGRQMWFLNGRSLRDRVLARVVREAYRGHLENARQPVAFLQLSLDPATVDVNVHPGKAEVRLRDQRRLFGFLVDTLREAVRRTDMATPGERMIATMNRREGASDRAGPGAWGARQAVLPQTRGERPQMEVREVAGEAFVLPAAPVDSGQPREPAESGQHAQPGDDLRGPYLQIARTYLVRPLPDGFEIVDQHAMHERLTFEALRRDVRAGRVEVQRYLVPELVECSRAEVQLLAGCLEALARIGIDLALFGETTVAVQGLPARLRRPDAEGLVRDLIEILARTGRPPDAEEVIEDVLHSAACRSSVMAGDVLADEEIRALLERARELDTDQTCPHGRPTRVRFTLADLERAFGRR